MKFSDFSGLRLLEWFFDNPTRKIHYRGLCRETKLNPVTVADYAGQFVERGWLLEERVANLRFFLLNNESFVVRAHKRAFFLEKLRRAGVGGLVGEGAISLALYGSHASGEYDERSDVDLLLVGRKESENAQAVPELEKKLRKKLQVGIIPLEKWENEKQRNPFMQSVTRNHVLLKGSPL